MVKKRGLGKSLDALLAYTGTENEQNSQETSSAEKFCQLSIEHIQCGKYQPRREMDPEALEELANSIRTQGIIQPLIVRKAGDKYEIIAGERRFRAAQIAGLSEVPAIIRHIPDEAAIAIALIENIQRENLNPIEEAIALQRLIDEFTMTHQQVAEAVGKSRVTVTNLLRLLTLPPEIKQFLEKGKLEMGHARTLISLPASLQLRAAEMIVSGQLSVRETENMVRRLQTPDPKNIRTPLNSDLKDWQENLARFLKMRVNVQCNSKGRGKLVIHYHNLEELKRLMSQFDRD